MSRERAAVPSCFATPRVKLQCDAFRTVTCLSSCVVCLRRHRAHSMALGSHRENGERGVPARLWRCLGPAQMHSLRSEDSGTTFSYLPALIYGEVRRKPLCRSSRGMRTSRRACSSICQRLAHVLSRRRSGCLA